MNITITKTFSMTASDIEKLEAVRKHEIVQSKSEMLRRLIDRAYREVCQNEKPANSPNV